MISKRLATLFVVAAVHSLICAAGTAADLAPLVTANPAANDFRLADEHSAADIYTDPLDATVVRIAGGLLSDDVERVTGRKPAVKGDVAALGKNAVLIGTIGHCPAIDKLIEAKRIDVSQVRDRWESYTLATVDSPMPGVDRALVIAGSDRRGTAYGVGELSEQIGVSPWYWWADVTPRHRSDLAVKAGAYVVGPPAVKYRGIFINDEDWGLYPWASKTFEPQFGNIGPKTYEKVFELLLRLKANYLWPAMHPVSTEFGSVDANMKLADDWAIVMGASHAEPMLRNNVHWDKALGEWRYDTNHDHIYQYWEEWAQKRGKYENVWTVGIRGIHDSPMLGPKDVHERVKLLERAIDDQRSLLAKYVDPKVENVPQIFVPYKEVLTLYRAGQKVPDDVTLVWPDDNHGYIRELSTPAEQKRAGRSGVYYHISYYGKPEDYLWLCTTPPSLIWEEMSKAYDNDARAVWVLNVGDIKPGEIDTEFFLRLARNLAAFDESCQMKFLTEWARREFGDAHAAEIAAVLDEYYRLNFPSRPEHLANAKFTSNYGEIPNRLERFAKLVEKTNALYDGIETDLKDAFYELVVYPVRGSALMNQKFLSPSLEEANKAYDQIQAETAYYNERVAGGKWKHIMSAAPRKQSVFDKPKPREAAQPTTDEKQGGYISVDAVHVTRRTPQDGADWKVIDGLGRAGACVALWPTQVPVTGKAELAYDVTVPSGADAKVLVYCIPTHAFFPGTQLRYAVSVDDEPVKSVDIDTAEFSREWSENVLRGAAIGVTESHLTAGKHTLRLRPLDAGLVFDKIVVDLGGLKPSQLGPPETAAR